MHTLLLNADYRPLQAISWKKAICLWFDDKVEIIEEYQDIDINSISFSMKCPAVVKLTNYKKNHARHDKVKFSRYNVFYRDNFQCQYCGKHATSDELTFDHVLPRSHGGKTEWTNIVTACHPCNSKKANKLLNEIDMKPLRFPKEPQFSEITKYGSFFFKTPDIWKNYIL